MAGGERSALERIAAAAGALEAPDLGIGDDAAVVAGGTLLFAADLVVAGVHADLSYCSLEDVGWKAIAVNASDMAAMGGVPLHAVVSVVLPTGTDLDLLYDGLAAAATHYGCRIAGGDLSGGHELVVSVAMTGTTSGRAPVLRRGARPGDALLVTGPLGASAAGLALLRGDPAERGPLATAHRRPIARVLEGVAAATAGATAMIDVSDGLGCDLDRLATASGVGVELDTVPVAPGASLDDALAGGEDYELVFTTPDPAGVAAAFAAGGLRAPVLIGRCAADPSVRRMAGERLPIEGFEHEL